MTAIRDVIRLPKVLDRTSVHALRPRIECLGTGAAIVLDGAYLRQIETPGVQLLCALVLAAEGRGASVAWTRVSAMLINYVNLLGIGDIIRLDGTRREARETLD